MGEPIEQRGRHLGVAEHGRPFAEREVGGDDDRGVLVKSADQMEQQLPASARERQIAQFVEDQQIEPRQMLGELSDLDGPPSRAGSPDRWCYGSERGHRCGCNRSEEHTSELQSLMRSSYAVF